MSDKFLSEEDLDLRNLSQEELYAWWDEWLRAAQATNDMDEHIYSHGVFRESPARMGRAADQGQSIPSAKQRKAL